MTVRIELLMVGAVLLSACATRGEAMRDSLPEPVERVAEPVEAPTDPSLDGSVAAYVATALERHPELRAWAEKWRAASYRADAAEVFPRTTITYGFLPLPVETRLGPQRHRVGVRQGLPWPGQRAAASRAAAAQARVEESKIEDAADAIAERVELAYWDVWERRQRSSVLREQVTVLETTATVARGKVETGNGGLSSVTRMELATSRMREALDTNEARLAAAEERLRGAIASDVEELPVEPLEFAPESLDSTFDVGAAPGIDLLRRRVDAAVEKVEAAELTTRPTFSVGADYIFVTEGNSPADEAGRDAVMLMIGVSLPTSWSAEGARAEVSRREAAAAEKLVEQHLIDRQAVASEQRVVAEDAARRAKNYEKTLLPQAETAFEAALGDYETGRAGVADILLAQRDWFDLSIGWISARANYERAMAKLRRLTGSAPTGERDE